MYIQKDFIEFNFMYSEECMRNKYNKYKEIDVILNKANKYDVNHLPKNKFTV